MRLVHKPANIVMVDFAGDKMSFVNKSTREVVRAFWLVQWEEVSLWIEIDTSLPSFRVLRALEKIIEMCGKSAKIKVDNGLEFISDQLQQ